MFYAGGVVFLQKLGFVQGGRMRAIAKALVVLAFTAPLSGCGIFRCVGTAVYGVPLNFCA
jgi:hypothetical protein